ncbi:MAG: DUF1493 family protein [Clostridiales bacterium]|nr:DUF1493 family protein [Clostridiales bacterium]
MQSRVFDIVKKRIEKYTYDAANITMDTNLINDLSLNSLDLVNVLADIEDEFQIQFSDETISHIRLMSDIVQYIEQSEKV